MLRTNFSNGSLRHAQLVSVRGAKFNGADLRYATFADADLTQADFRDSRLDAAEFHGASYVKSKPPIGLPDDILSRCKPLDNDDGPESQGLHQSHLVIVGTLIKA